MLVGTWMINWIRKAKGQMSSVAAINKVGCISRAKNYASLQGQKFKLDTPEKLWQRNWMWKQWWCINSNICVFLHMYEFYTTTAICVVCVWFCVCLSSRFSYLDIASTLSAQDHMGMGKVVQFCILQHPCDVCSSALHLAHNTPTRYKLKGWN